MTNPLRPPLRRTARRIALLALLGVHPALGQQTATKSAQNETVSRAAEAAGLAQDSPNAFPVAGEALPESGFEWGINVGFSLPFGKADSGATLFNDTQGDVSPLRTRDGSMGGIVSYGVPLSLDLGYRLTQAWWVGLKPQASLGGFGDECPTAASCHWNDARLFAWLKHHFDPTATSDPWVGLGLGYEWLAAVAQVSLTPVDPNIPFFQGVSAKQTLSGPVLLVEGGLGFELIPHVHVGPYVSAAVGRYVYSSFDCSNALGCPEASAIDNGGFHGWVSVGLSGSHGP